MSLPASLTALSRDDLGKLVLEQQHHIAVLTAKVEALQAEVERLKREGQRQAAPFSKGTRVAAPKKPGRKPGKGLFRYRAAPEQAPLPGSSLEVPVTLRACPACGGRLVAAGGKEAAVPEGASGGGGRRRPLCRRPEPGRGWGRRGWRVGGEPAQLMAFETAAVTVYQIRARHRNAEVREVIPADYAGVLVTDRGRSYDASELAGVRQQKCLAHIQRALSTVLAQQHGPARAFSHRLKGLFRQAIEVWHAYHHGQRTGFAAQAQRLNDAITHHLRDRPLKDPDNRRLLNELGWNHDRGNLLRFLDDPRIEPTNNRAERALRPAVIARKVSQCSKNAQGAQTFAAFTSVVRTLAKTGADSIVEGLLHVFHSAQMPDTSAEACHQSR